jgi:aldose 1-epimerase
MFRVSTTKSGGRDILRLHDDASGAEAAVLPSYGFNLFDLRLPAAGQPRPILSAYEDFASNPRDAGRNGWPVLFPFPNRINGGKYTFNNKSYSIPTGGRPWAIHGFAIDVPWEVVAHEATESGASVTGRYQLSRQSPNALESWPADAVLEMCYTLAGRKLTLHATVSNPTALKLPFGLGFHPYFRLPLADGASLEKTRVIIPASSYWQLADFIPTGRTLAVEPRLDFRAGQSMKGLSLDDVLTGVVHDTSGHAVCRLVDENLPCEVRLTVPRAIRELVLYTPPGPGGVISVEPYTCTTDAINLTNRSVDAGLRVLDHDERFELEITLETM